jgi:thiamine-phosphate pyrophosphorylase
MTDIQLAPLYPITASQGVTPFSHVQQAKMFLETGIRFFQVREKTMPDSLLYRELLHIKQLCDEANARFLVNDRVDLALAVEAAGVHLGQNDLPVPVARRLLGEDAIIGVSTHDREQYRIAQESEADYVAIGPIFKTPTKKSEYPALGVNVVQTMAQKKRRPLVAIGGICLETGIELWKAGVDSVAVVSDIATAAEPRKRIQRYLEAWPR